MEPVQVGVMGCASIARRRMLPAMAASADVKVVAIASREGARAAELAAEYGCRPVIGYEALLDLEDVDAVYIPLPLSLHARWTRAALLAGKHVLAEKPLSTDPDSSRDLLKLAQDSALVVMENVMFIHHSQHAAVRQMLADGMIGEIRSMQATFAIPPPPGYDIRYDPDLCGGAVWDVGVYPVRAAVHLLGGGLRVAGAFLTASPGQRVDTSGSALLYRPDGVTALLSFGIEHAYTSRYEFHGSDGRLSVAHAFTPPASHVPVVTVQQGQASKEFHLAPDDQVANTLAAFAAAVRSECLPGPVIAECLRQARLLDAIIQYATAGPCARS